MTEADLLSAVLSLAKLYGWKAMHQRPAQTGRGWRTAISGDAGFPDLTLAKGGRVIFAELKSDTGRLSPAQKEWLEVLPDAKVWRPADLQRIPEVLR